jgi:hypothetical protein
MVLYPYSSVMFALFSVHFAQTVGAFCVTLLSMVG